jgi:hypothetical protein
MSDSEPIGLLSRSPRGRPRPETSSARRTPRPRACGATAPAARSGRGDRARGVNTPCQPHGAPRLDDKRKARHRRSACDQQSAATVPPLIRPAPSAPQPRRRRRAAGRGDGRASGPSGGRRHSRRATVDAPARSATQSRSRPLNDRRLRALRGRRGYGLRFGRALGVRARHGKRRGALPGRVRGVRPNPAVRGEIVAGDRVPRRRQRPSRSAGWTCRTLARPAHGRRRPARAPSLENAGALPSAATVRALRRSRAARTGMPGPHLRHSTKQGWRPALAGSGMAASGR